MRKQAKEKRGVLWTSKIHKNRTNVEDNKLVALCNEIDAIPTSTDYLKKRQLGNTSNENVSNHVASKVVGPLAAIEKQVHDLDLSDG